MLLQTLIIAVLSFLYSGRRGTGMAYTAVFSVLLAYLMSGQASAQLLLALQSAVIPNVVIARVSMTSTTVCLVCDSSTAVLLVTDDPGCK